MLNVECGMGCAGVLDGTGILGFLRTLGLISGMGWDEMQLSGELTYF